MLSDSYFHQIFRIWQDSMTWNLYIHDSDSHIGPNSLSHLFESVVITPMTCPWHSWKQVTMWFLDAGSQKWEVMTMMFILAYSPNLSWSLAMSKNYFFTANVENKIINSHCGSNKVVGKIINTSNDDCFHSTFTKRRLHLYNSFWNIIVDHMDGSHYTYSNF